MSKPPLNAKAPTPLEWGDTVLALRHDLRLTQEAMAKRCRVSLRTLQRWETGQNVPSEPVRQFVLNFRRSAVAKQSRAARG